ncbi:HpcH/HpaI aldolase family protein [Pyxidicoccus xibeiensis]|uniref:HpcH/HpaI aldolase family protein n=1 Tax=Pyxidicoccus xibeiensis TaxID=2906759 RepID=UPI0020A742F4|nr:aldolase/citrate lyase family protein [Pyxidicoccus xibeiensis]MCP3143656.1 aldolase/citrate lyase family protein [Pyxidicoccus xibeiensis]
MIRPNKLKQAFAKQHPVFGIFCSTPSPMVVEMIGCAGFDFVIIDTEHTLVNPETLENMVRAAEVVGLTPLVRVSENAPGPILRALDAGAQGVVVPRVRGAADAERAVRASRYHPEGERGMGTGRAARFGGVNLQEYVKQANAETLVVVMIEDQAGVEDIEAILQVPGVDLVLEGAADLSQSLGIPWSTRHPRVREALYRVQAAARARGIPFCAIPRAMEDSLSWWQQGVRTFVVGDERGVSFRALQAHLRPYQQLLMERMERDITEGAP